MTDEVMPSVGDMVDLQITKDRDYRYVAADNMVVTHMRGRDYTGVELHAVATETGLVSSQIRITEAEPDSPPAGRPVGVMAVANQVHVCTVRLEAPMAIEMVVALLGHMKRQKLADMDAAMARIREAVEG